MGTGEMDGSEWGAPPSCRPSRRPEPQWGMDMESEDTCVEHCCEADNDGSSHFFSSSASALNTSGSSSDGTEGKACGLTIDTSPPIADALPVFKKRPSPPLSSPTAVKSSLAQKKKRPAPLLLPDVAVAVGGPSPAATVVSGPTLSTVDLNELALENMITEGDDVYGIQSSKGKRRYMEDTCCAIPNINGDPGEAYYGVFDGHGGRRAADFAAQHLYEYITSDERFGTDVAEAVGSAFLKADKTFVELAEKQEMRDGTTAVAAYVRGGQLLVANVGDSRAVLSRNGEAVALTEDHRPSIESEQLRIESRGGTVFHMGSWRVEGVLA